MIFKRSARIVATGLSLLTLAYWISPYIAVGRFAGAAERGDAAAIMARLDIPRIRNAFARQIVRAYPVDPTLLTSLDPVARQAASLVAVTYVDALIAERFNPDLLVRALANRKLSDEPAGQGPRLPSVESLGSALDIFMEAGFTGPVSFGIHAKATGGERYRLGFRFIGGSWRLVSVGLPSAVLAEAVGQLKSRSP
ncbi:hypothetical protein ABIE41_001048 [Bosea sp. OAE506]|uniref:DUF2939 domain-containing protein n=1 Tax=Bosea sp. OAE506 TaxID=2663870 RepID=UPI00178AB795